MHEDYHEHAERPHWYVVFVVLLLSVAGLFYAFFKPVENDVQSGVVRDIVSEQDSTLIVGDDIRAIKEQTLLVEIKTEEGKKQIIVLNDYKPVEEGDKVFIRPAAFGSEEFNVVDVSRSRGILILLVLFVVLVVLTSGWKGVNSLVALLFSFAVIFAIILPQILKGVSPVGVGIAGAALILVPSLYLSYGYNKKSIAAFLGIFATLIFVGLTADYFVEALKFTGLSEASVFLSIEAESSLNMLGLLTAGIIIAAVGVLDDVAAIQSSIVFSLARANPELRGTKLFRESMRVGKDHISAVVNTLVLAYTGAALPLILLLSLRGMPLDYFVSIEIVAEEIARTLISSSGLLLAVPLTTLIATMMVKRS